jgi:hypothetical protein
MHDIMTLFFIVDYNTEFLLAPRPALNLTALYRSNRISIEFSNE